jgi:xanthine dehydrogenase accessory factor
MPSSIWDFLLEHLMQDIRVTLLLVVDHQGSSPGRKGFKMAISATGDMYGSIGGGIMEHKLVEKAKKMMQKGSSGSLLIHQVHRKDSHKNRSGMICSGEQTVVIIPIKKEWIDSITLINESLLIHQKGLLQLAENTFDFNSEITDNNYFSSSLDKETTGQREWHYQEIIPATERVIIIGGGHVGKALARQMKMLDFEVWMIDDREDLNTFVAAEDVDKKLVLSYDSLTESLKLNKDDYLVIMSFGYRTDKIILKQLIASPCRFKGMMGSQAKIDQLWKELIEEGYRPESLDQIKAPVGLPIHSQTPEEIAVSVAAQIIAHKNTPLL